MDTKVIAICGPSGAGKDTVIKHLKDTIIRANFPKLCTSRPKRYEEEDNYIFMNKEDFHKQYWYFEVEYNKWKYGLLRSSLTQGFNIIVASPEEIRQLVSNNINTYVIYLDVCGETRLKRSLKRGDCADEIVRRYNADKVDFSEFLNEYNGCFAFLNNETEDDLKRIAYFISGLIDGSRFEEKRKDKINQF